MDAQSQNPIKRLFAGLARLLRFALYLPWRLWRVQLRLGLFWRSLPGRFWRALQWLVRSFVKLLGLLARFLRNLPGWLVRGAKWLVRFVLYLPWRLWRVQVWLGLFLRKLPGRLWRGLKWTVRFIGSLPGRLRVWLVWSQRPLLVGPRAARFVILVFTINLSLTILFAVILFRGANQQEPVYVADMRMTATWMAVEQTRQSDDAAPTATPTVATPTVSHLPSPPKDSGALAFVLRRDGNSDLYALDVTSQKLLQLTNHPAEERDPAWSPDGQTIAFASRRNQNWDIYQLDLVSGAFIRLTRSPHYDGHPSWSNDGLWLAFESYRGGNLDIYIMAADRSELVRLTANRAADFAPAWSPDGRHILFVSYRDHSQDIFVYSLDVGSESAIVNLTNTPDRDESDPCWSPDGSQVAFSVGRPGQQVVYVAPFDAATQGLDETQIQALQPGSSPAWSPGGSSVAYRAFAGGQYRLYAAGLGQSKETWLLFENSNPLVYPDWTRSAIRSETLAWTEKKKVLASSILYVENVMPPLANGPSFQMVPLVDVNGGSDREWLSDRVDDSFVALRQRIIAETGYDYLATLGDSFRAITAPSREGQSLQSWHKAGRAFDQSQGFYDRDDQLIELVREDIGVHTYWRVYFKTALQDGSLGAPLQDTLWNLKAYDQSEGALQASQRPPGGYYVDFTALAQDYGWERAPALPRWPFRWTDALWWQYQKTLGQTWLEAMLEIYRPDQIEAVFGPLD